jgi:hypothetical protein
VELKLILETKHKCLDFNTEHEVMNLHKVSGLLVSRTGKWYGFSSTLFIILNNKDNIRSILCDGTPLLMRFEAFMVTECSEVFLGDQPCKYGVTVQHFGLSLSPSSGLMC